MKTRRHWRASLTLASTGLLPALAQASALALHCQTPAPAATQLLCDYQAPAGLAELPEAHTANGLPLPLRSLRALSGEQDPIAVLVMIDVSDPARQADVARSQLIAEGIAQFYPETIGLGLAEFAGELSLKAALDSSRADFRTALQGLKAVGLTTELYRSVLQGIERLAAQGQARRRWLVVLSDGLAEDVAYSHADVVRAAQEQGVIISALGLPRSRAKAVALQSLRRLAEETGGGYAEVGPETPDFTKVLPAVDAGSQLEIDLSAIPAGSGEQEIVVTLNPGGAVYQTKQRYQAPAAAVTTTTAPAANVEVEAIKAAVREALPANPPSAAYAPPQPVLAPPVPAVAPAPTKLAGSTPVLLWLGAGGSVGALIAIIGLIAYVRRKLPTSLAVRASLDHAAAPASAPVAFLVAREGDTRHPIWRLPCRIGRAANNEVVLDDASVSRHHAEIERRPDGGFNITDLDSLNGVFIEGKRVANSRIFEGCQLDIGDLAFRFTLIDPEDSDQHATVMIRTEAPTTVGPALAAVEPR